MTGIICIDKPKDFTSFDVIAVIRGICKEKKCGHTGTLDPLATGVMTVMLGGATRFLEFIPCHDKAYEATLKLGIITDTLDITGKVIEERKVNSTGEDFEKACANFVGEIKQLPPMYSAVSVNGKRLYQLAREGKEAERPERTVTINELKILEKNERENTYKIYVDCSNGTYIRSLVSDIGELLGCGAVLTELRRVKANGFTVDQCVTLEELQQAKDSNTLEKYLHSVEEICCYTKIFVTEAQAKRFSNGGELFTSRISNCKGDGLYNIYAPDKTFLGIGEVDGGDILKVKRIFINK